MRHVVAAAVMSRLAASPEADEHHTPSKVRRPRTIPRRTRFAIVTSALWKAANPGA
jgi:hypothetical protein